MALFGNSSNPTIKDSIFTKVKDLAYSGPTMTVKGSVIKTFILLSLTVVSASYTWYLFSTGTNLSSWMYGGIIAGFILSLIISFSPRTAPYLSQLYAVAEGLALGALSVYFENAFAEIYPGIVSSAVALTLLTALIMLFCYQTRLIKVTNKLRSIITVAVISALAFYSIILILSLFKVSTAFFHSSSLLSIGISLLLVVIASAMLLLNFDFIEKGSKSNVPKYMEWYGAFAVLATLIWLYIEILNLLSKIARR
ncbi:MAG: Bax inhibitor-1/YccA family protein [Prevotellaceae bacterium]|jgi:uncharacterized YccA/Bax inhibitor family protein|nr:Bax inhibitor-1/YccA family protein [Prevotellaceae bacterium]